MNQALLAKVGWRLGCDREGLVGCGNNIYFWKDIWVPEVGVLVDHALQDISDRIDVERLAAVLNTFCVEKIICICFDDSGRDSDKLIWGLTKNGSFSVSSAYASLFDGNAWRWKFIWALKIPLKLQTFLWNLLHKKILTNSQRVRRRMTSDDLCPRCGSETEDLDHLFRSCSRLTLMGAGIIRQDPLLLEEWLET
ncbi:hypothetical protein ACOSP7_015576 [Xanthoceras sorbifolium]